MKQNYQELLRPDIINSLSGLSLIARVVSDGFLSGLNQSHRVGAGLTFSQYRAYEAGDDLRLLDWKMLARSGRYYIKQSEIDTQITVKFILDASKSMLHQEGDLSKLAYAKVVIASLAKIAQNQGDQIGLFALNDSKLTTVLPKTHKQHYTRFIHELAELEAHGKWPKEVTELKKLQGRNSKEILFFITDLHEEANELTTTVKGLKTNANEVIVLQILGQNEIDFNYEGYLIFEDLELGTKIKVDAKTAKENYVSEVQKKLTNTKNVLLSNNIGHHVFQLNDSIVAILNLFLRQRQRLL